MATTTVPKSKTFSYKAKGKKDGKLYEGRLAAPNAESVEQGLLERGYDSLDVQEVANKGLNRELTFGTKRVKLIEIATWARQLAVMIEAGLPIVRALEILEKQTTNSSLKKALNETKKEVNTGVSFGEALSAHPKIFSDSIVEMIKAGEEGGFLDSSLNDIAVDLEKEVQLRAKIISALAYPVVVLIMAIFAVIGMLLFIVPIFQDLFASLGGQLPLPTRILVIASDIMKVGIFPLIGLSVIAGLWWKNNKQEDYVQNFVDPFKLKVPIFGKVYNKIVMARFTRSFTSLIRSNVPIIQALDIAGKTSGSLVLRRALDDVKQSVQQGDTIGAPMQTHAVFPVIVSDMVTVGEEVGSMEKMLSKLANYFDQQVEADTATISSLIEPLMVAVVGSIIGGLVIALYMPILYAPNLIK